MSLALAMRDSNNFPHLRSSASSLGTWGLAVPVTSLFLTEISRGVLEICLNVPKATTDTSEVLTPHNFSSSYNPWYFSFYQTSFLMLQDCSIHLHCLHLWLVDSVHLVSHQLFVSLNLEVLKSLRIVISTVSKRSLFPKAKQLHIFYFFNSKLLIH